MFASDFIISKRTSTLLGYFIFAVFLVGAVAARTHAATFTVDRGDDAISAAAGVCSAAPNDCSLRGAMFNANSNGPGADSIDFNIPGGGVKVINLQESLPFINTSLTINGASQPGYFGKPLIQVDGVVVANSLAFLIDAPAANIAVTIVGLAITHHDNGIYSNCGTFKCDITLLGNFIGTNANGTTAAANFIGIDIHPSANSKITIGGDGVFEGNIISGNHNKGIAISAYEGGNVLENIQVKILGNKIGTDFTGNVDLGNGDIGLYLSEFSDGGVRGCDIKAVIGASTALARNLISGNDQDGIEVAVADLTIQGNYIGTNIAGTLLLGNGDLSNFLTNHGIRIDAQDGGNYIVGGEGAGEGNLISGNNGHGLHLRTRFVGNGTAQLKVLGNYIGTNQAGTAVLSNHGTGISISGSGSNSIYATIGGVTSAARNIISGNYYDGIGMDCGTVSIYGNYIGTDKSGTIDLGNGFDGISVTYDGKVRIGGTLVLCGTPYDAGNLISGNDENGIRIPDFADFPATIQRNRIGTNAAGTGAVPNGTGLNIGSIGNTIGSSSSSIDGNVISGNTYSGIFFEGASGNAVYGNKIGTNSAGSDYLPNGEGIRILNSSGTQIGLAGNGTATNIISGNVGNGIIIVGDSPGNKIENNLIGGGVGGNNLGNQESGVHIESSQNFVGSPSGTGNTIVFNKIGVWIKSGTNNAIRRNSIFSNDQLGIDLDAEGVQANDTGDGDNGANRKQNYPVLSLATPNSIVGSLNSTPNTSFDIDFFRVDSCSSSGHGEGRYYLGSKNVSTDGAGNVQFNSPLVFLSVGQVVTATATVAGAGANDTSEFSQCRTVESIPSLSFSAATYTANEGVAMRTIIVNRSGGTTPTLTVDYATSDGTASEGQDYIATSGTLTFDSGEVTKSFNVTLLNDNLDEADETIKLQLSNASGAILSAPSAAVLTIVDNDNAPSISITDVTASEGNSGTTNFTFHVQLSAPSALNVSVDYATANGNATTPGDYTAGGGPLNFTAGETDKTVVVSVVGDMSSEPDENFFVNLVNPINASLADAQGVGTILNDDAPFIIRGVVKKADDTPLGNVTMTLQGSQSGSTVTDPNGRYAFGNLAPNGNYTVTATANGYTCAPPNQLYSNLATDVTNADFIATPSGPTAAPAQISGVISTNYGHPLAGVTLSLTGSSTSGNAITNELGRFTFANLDTDGFYTLTAERANYSFAPPVLAFSLLADKTDANFSATPLAAANSNPLETPEFFVRQQYLDFLGREPDQAGLDYWSGQLRACGNDERCLSARRVDVSAAFFVAEEFQETGSVVYRLYQASYGRQPMYSEFQPDRSKVIGGADLESSKRAFIEEWIKRDEFMNNYPESLTNEQFVTKLMATADLTNLAKKRQAFIGQLDSGATRAEILGEIIELSVFKSREYNPSFVLMQYFGYLRRDADQGGYDFWLNILKHQHPANYHAMVCSFVTSAEYQDRFSPVRTRSNVECGP